MKGKKKSVEETWKVVLRNMTKEELRLLVYEQEDYTPKLGTLTKEVLKQDYGITEEMLSSRPDAGCFFECLGESRAEPCQKNWHVFCWY